MFRGLGFLVACCLSSWGLAVEVRTVGPELFVNEVKIVTFADLGGGGTGPARATKAAKLIAAGPATAELAKTVSKKDAKIKVGSTVVATLTLADARAAKMSLADLATSVTSRLQSARKLGAFVTTVKSLELPPDKTGTVAVTGWGLAKCAVSAKPANIVEVSKVPGAVLVKPVQTGKVTIVLRNGDELLAVPVAVKPYAYSKPIGLVATVVGDPADKSVVAGAVATTIQTGPGSQPGARVFAKVDAGAPLYPGQFRFVRARVHASGPGLITYSDVVQVKVQNAGDGTAREDVLWYSNEPENVSKSGRLYWAELPVNQSARLLYHHKNTSSWPLVIRYKIVNPGDKPAEVALSLGEGKPDANPTRAGYIAGEQFLTKWLSQSAEVVSIPPRSIVPVTVRRLAVGQTFSGLASMSLRPGGAERVIVIGDSVLPQVLGPDWQPGLGVTGAWHACRPIDLDGSRIALDGHSLEVYPKPFREVRMDYEVGGRFGFARIGQEAISNLNSERSLAGNFGVIYDIQGTLSNPTPSPAEVELLFEASAGYGSGLFVINGDLVKIGLIQPKQEIVLATIKLPPGVSKELNLKTIPLSGANYPVTLIVRPTGIELKSNVAR